MEVPSDRYYTKTHEWAKPEDGTVRVGITAYAVEQLGDITYVEVKPVGTEVKKGEALGFVESNKAVEDIYAPISGRIVEVNSEAGVAQEGQEAAGRLELITEDPYGGGWIVAIETSDPSEIQELLKPEEYEELLKREH